MASHEEYFNGDSSLLTCNPRRKVTIDKLALTDIFFLPHFNKPYNYITMAALTAEK